MNLIAKTATTAITVTTLGATAALSADYQISRTLELSASVVEIWSRIGDFCDIDDWHPSVRSCSLHVVDGALARTITTDAGHDVVHKRIATEPGLSYTYKTMRSSLPIENFVATLSIEPFEKPLIMWSARFSSDDPATEQTIVDEIEAGMSAIEDSFRER